MSAAQWVGIPPVIAARVDVGSGPEPGDLDLAMSSRVQRASGRLVAGNGTGGDARERQLDRVPEGENESLPEDSGQLSGQHGAATGDDRAQP